MTKAIFEGGGADPKDAKLVGDREGQFSIRINRQYRICFDWEDGDAWNVEIVDYHD